MTEAAWIGLAGVLVGGVITGLTTWLTMRSAERVADRRIRHEQQARWTSLAAEVYADCRRLVTWHTYFSAENVFEQRKSDEHEGMSMLLDKVQSDLARLSILAGDSGIRDAAEALSDDLGDLRHRWRVLGTRARMVQMAHASEAIELEPAERRVEHARDRFDEARTAVTGSAGSLERFRLAVVAAAS